MLFALLLSVQLLAPAGFMPAFSDSAISIVACPDAGDAKAPMQMGGAGHHKASHQMCPYAAVSSLGGLGPDWTPFLWVPAFGLSFLPNRSLVQAMPQAVRERPPARGPPIPS